MRLDDLSAGVAPGLQNARLAELELGPRTRRRIGV